MKNLAYLLDRYYVSKKGVVINKKDGNALTIQRTNSNRKYIAVMNKNHILYTYDLATLLGTLYIDNPKGYKYIRFKDNDFNNCDLNNLEWVDYDNRTFPHKKEVIMMDLDGKIIKEFDSLINAGKYVNRHPVSISCCCKGKTQTSGGYKWKFKE